MTRCKFTLPAKRDLKEIAAYIRRDNPEAAERVVKRIRDVCREMLVDFRPSERCAKTCQPGCDVFPSKIMSSIFTAVILCKLFAFFMARGM